jgi:hypothetical protein
MKNQNTKIAAGQTLTARFKGDSELRDHLEVLEVKGSFAKVKFEDEVNPRRKKITSFEGQEYIRDDGLFFKVEATEASKSLDTSEVLSKNKKIQHEGFYISVARNASYDNNSKLVDETALVFEENGEKVFWTLKHDVSSSFDGLTLDQAKKTFNNLEYLQYDPR